MTSTLRCVFDKRYAADQPRDDHGRFGEGTGEKAVSKEDHAAASDMHKGEAAGHRTLEKFHLDAGIKADKEADVHSELGRTKEAQASAKEANAHFDANAAHATAAAAHESAAGSHQVASYSYGKAAGKSAIAASKVANAASRIADKATAKTK